MGTTAVELLDETARELFYLPVQGGVLMRRRIDAERRPTPAMAQGGQPLRMTPVMENHKVFVGWTNEPLAHANPSYKRLPTEYPSYATYDATRVDPMQIQTAMRGQIFAQLGEDDTDYTIVDGNQIMRSGMSLTSTVHGRTDAAARFVSDTRTLATEWSIGVTLGVGDDTTKYSGQASATYREAAKDLTTYEAFWSVARAKTWAYDIALDPFVVPVTEAFREAVSGLPEPAAATESALAGLDNPEIDARMRATLEGGVAADAAWPYYVRFVETWGTHYAAAISYGTIRMEMLRYDSTKIETMRSKGFNASLEAKGSIKGVPVSGKVEGGYSRIDGFERLVKDETAITQTSGTDAEPQPIEITLAPLSDLLDPAILKDDSVYDDWRWRAPMLRAAIRAHCGGTDPLDDLDVRVFELEMLGFAPVGRNDEKSLYGWLDLMWIADSVKAAGKTRIWDRSKAGGSRVNFHANKSDFESTWVSGTTPRVMQVFRAKDYAPDKSFAACISMIDYNTNSGLGDYANPYRITFGGIEKQTRLLTGDGPRGERLTGDWTQADLQSGRMTMRVRFRETPLWLVPPAALKPLLGRA